MIPPPAADNLEYNPEALDTRQPAFCQEAPVWHIRKMQESDLEQVQAIDRLSFSLPWPAKAYRYELLENPNSLLWVAEIESVQDGSAGKQEVLGMIVIWLILDEAHIATLAVHPEYRGRGIASELLVTGLQEAIQRGAKLATLEVRAGNLSAQELYRRFGFQIVGDRRAYYKDNREDALIMSLHNLGETSLDLLARANGREGGIAL